jgi:Fe2+ or Zn2+ uptake regulation protein
MRGRLGAEIVRQRLVATLSEVPAPMTTADLRRCLTRDFHQELVHEQIYRNLEVLHRRGDVARLKTAGRHTLWMIRSGADSISHPA